MASTSWVWLLRAITVGSLSTMPRALAYTRVLAVPRSMARSLARPALSLFPLSAAEAGLPPAAALGKFGLRRQRLQLAGELLDAGVHRAGLAGARPEDQRPDQADDHRKHEVQEVAHRGTSATGVTSWAQVPQSSPPSQVSRFQI